MSNCREKRGGLGLAKNEGAGACLALSYFFEWKK